MQRRGLLTSEFWAAALAIIAMILLAAESGRDAQVEALFGIALIVSAYIAGRSLIKAVQMFVERKIPPTR